MPALGFVLLSQIELANPHQLPVSLAATPFAEGMCRAADSRSQVIDGFEFSYGYHSPTPFVEGRKTMDASRDLFEDIKGRF